MTDKSKEERAKEIDRAIKAADKETDPGDEGGRETGGQGLEKFLAKLDDCITKMDGLGSRMDALEDRYKGRHADDDAFAEQPNAEEHREPGEAKRLIADDGELRNALADAQARADNCAAQWGARAPAPLVGESLAGYRRRLVRPFQKHSELYRNVDFTGWPGIAFDEAEKRIYADSAVAAASADAVPEGMLRAVTTEMPNGSKMTKFVGHPGAWMNLHMPMRRYCTRINPQGGQRAFDS